MPHSETLPLAGIRVIDLSQVYQGPYCTQLMAQAGAEVIKIEPPKGEPMRLRQEVSRGSAVPFAMLNQHKRAMTLNLKAEEGKDRYDYGRDEFIDRVWEWKHRFGGVIQSQMRAIGDSVDWERERFTLDDGLSKAVQTIFKELFDRGLIYRAKRLVNWSPVLRTAISDIEVVYSDDEGELVTLRYGDVEGKGPHADVATTRVETMLGDVAVAVHPDDERYKDLVGTTLPHPFIEGRSMVVIADDYVDPEFGTGAVKITPAHDPNDFEMGRRHDLDMPEVIDETGHIANTGTRFDGMDRFEAREEIRLALE